MDGQVKDGYARWARIIPRHKIVSCTIAWVWCDGGETDNDRHFDFKRDHSQENTLEQVALHRSQTATQGQAGLEYPNAASGGEAYPRSRPFRSRHRQQTPRL